tara:strand:- start:2702 stop:2833 length:132 start_codon:yes stop_codon:yes gene_type:complete
LIFTSWFDKINKYYEKINYKGNIMDIDTLKKRFFEEEDESNDK